MRPLLLVASLVAAVALGASQLPWSENQPGTRGTPTGPCDAGGIGVDLQEATSLHAIVSCSDGSNITGGTELGWYCSPSVGKWMPAASYTNFTVPTGASPQIGPEFKVINPFGRFLYASSGVACDGQGWDGGVTVTIEKWVAYP